MNVPDDRLQQFLSAVYRALEELHGLTHNPHLPGVLLCVEVRRIASELQRQADGFRREVQGK